MSESLFVLRAYEHLGAFQHLLNHHGHGTFYLHHPFKLQRQVLGSPDVECHAPYVAFVNRSHHLGHHGVAHLFGKGDEVLFLRTHFLGNHGNAGALKELPHHVWRHIARLFHLANNIADSRYVNAEQFYLRRGGRGSLHHLCQGGGQRHLVAEVYVPLAQEFAYLRPRRVDARQDGENGFATFLYLLVKHVVSLVELHQSGRAKDDEHRVDVVEFLFAEVDGNAQVLARPRGQDVDGVAHR